MPDEHKTAEELIEEALALSEMSHDSYVGLRNKIPTPPGLDRLDKFRVPLYDLTSEPPDSRKAEVADKSMKAGRLFERVGEWNMALTQYYSALSSYEELRGEEFREKEALALRFCALVYLTFTESVPDGQQKSNYYRFAADFFIRQAWIYEKLNKLEEARDAYRNASHRYYWADAMKESADAAVDEAELSEKLGDIERSAQTFELAAKHYHKAEGHMVPDLLRNAAYHYKQLATQESKCKALAVFNSAIEGELSLEKPDLLKAIGDYLEAINLAKELERYEEMDQLRYRLFILQRKIASEEGRLLFVIWSYINDWLWGYGTKFLRLCILIMLIILVFAFPYILFREVQFRIRPVEPAKSPIWYALLCIGYSLYSFLPTGVIKWLTGAGLVVEFDATGATKLLSKIEALIGVGCLAMAVVMVRRKLSRSHVKAGI